MAVPCPVCDKTMHLVYFFDIELDFCRLCGGLWFDGGEMEKVLSKRNVPRRLTVPLAYDLTQRKVEEGKRLCPRCKDTMKVMKYKEVNVDICLRCQGIWLDRYELAQIMGQAKQLKKIRYVDDGMGQYRAPEADEAVARAAMDFATEMHSNLGTPDAENADF